MYIQKFTKLRNHIDEQVDGAGFSEKILVLIFDYVILIRNIQSNCLTTTYQTQ